MRWIALRRVLSVIAFSAAVPACAVAGAPVKATFVEVWCGGDDGLTLRLRDAIETRFRLSADFVLSEGMKSGTLLVSLPTNVKWKRVGERTRVEYLVEFGSVTHQRLGKSIGACWDDDLGECAERIVGDAKSAASALH